MRLHFISRLALLIMAGFLVVASQVWTGDTLQWIFVAGGALAVLGALADLARPSTAGPALNGLVAVVGGWTVIEAFAFEGSNLKWWSFASAVALAVLGAVGLSMHEMTTERVVHELSVTAGREERTPVTT